MRKTPDGPEAFARRLGAALSAEDWPSAEAMLRQAADAPGAPAAVFFNLGQVLVRAGRSDEAAHWYERAVAAEPGYVNAWCELGAWSAERGDPARALTAYETAIQHAPRDADAVRGAARAALALGDWARAGRYWAAIAASGADGEAALGLLRVALETGDPAAKAMRAAIARNPKLRPALMKTLSRVGRGALPLRPRDL